MRPFLRGAIFFLGWILSPFTMWNDALVNIPIAYLCANIYIKFFPVNFPHAVVVFYWLSNVAGIAMMYFSGKQIINGRGKEAVVEFLKLLAAMIGYSILLLLLGNMGVIKPI